MNIIFYGDSLTSGENNQFVSYVHYFEEALTDKVDNLNVFNQGISGSTIGDYSIYPVINGDLLHQLANTSLKSLSEADYIFLEYGINDSTAIVSRYVSIEHVLIDIIKCEDFIHQINAKCKIYFVAFSGSIVDDFANSQHLYLKNNYLKHIDELKPSSYEIKRLYNTIVKVASDIFDRTLFIDLDIDMDKDGLHPNNEGYMKIGEELAKLFQNELFIFR